MGENLRASDVEKLIADPSVEILTETATKLSRQYQSSLSESERRIAEDIFRIMVRDAEGQVRAALSENLKLAPSVPHDVAVALANDISDPVALPMILFSDALEEGDLLEIVASQSPDRQNAVAGRTKLPDQVARAIVDCGNETALTTLVSNHKTTLNEQTLHLILDKHDGNDRIQNPLVLRPVLPVSVAEKLVTRVSERLQNYLVRHHHLSEETAADLILRSRERVTVGLSGSDEDTETLVAQLKRNGRLTPSIILRAICCGDIRFFEVALARLANVPTLNARALVHDSGTLGLKSIYQKAGLPPGLFPAFRAAVNAFHNSEAEKTDDGPETTLRRLLEHVLTEHSEIVDQYGISNVDYLIARFNKLEQFEKAL